MNIDADKLLNDAIRHGLHEAVKDKLTGYSSPLDKLIAEVIAARSGEFRQLLDDSIKSCMTDVEFRESIASAVRTSLARTLIQRFGGEMEKQVNVLKSDPSTRARITLAIEEIVKSQSSH